MLRHVIKNFAPSAKSIPTKNKQLEWMASGVVQTSQYQFSDQLRFIIRIAYRKDHYLKITLHKFSKTILQFRVLLIQLGFIPNKLQLLTFIFCSICDLYLLANANRKGWCYNPIYSSFLKDSWYYFALETLFTNDWVNSLNMYGSVYCRKGRYYFPMYYTRLTTVYDT